MIRNNKQTWRLAKYLHDNIAKSEYSVNWNWQYQEFRNKMYDEAKKLMYAFAYNAFTGEDNHED